MDSDDKGTWKMELEGKKDKRERQGWECEMVSAD